MKQSIIINLQGTDKSDFPEEDRKRYLFRWMNESVPIHIALTPCQREFWKDLEEEIGTIVSRKGSGLILEGLLHVCPQRHHTIRDPYHQGICTSIFQEDEPFDKQLEDISEGIEFLEKIFGIKPKGYVPPQHLWNSRTVEVIEKTSLQFLVTNAIFPGLLPYEEGKIRIIPSGSIKRGRTKNPVVHAYYDKIITQSEKIREMEKNAVPLDQIPSADKTLLHRLNKPAIWVAKQARDIARIGKWLTSYQFRHEDTTKEILNVRRKLYEEARTETNQTK